MKLYCVSLIIFFFGNVACIPVGLASKKYTFLPSPINQENFLAILSSSDSLNFLSTMMQADPEKINEIIILLDNMILEAQQGHDALNNAKALAAQTLANADEALSQAGIAEVAAKNKKQAADDRLQKAQDDKSKQLDKLLEELQILQAVKGQLQSIKDFSDNSDAFIQMPKPSKVSNAPVSLLSNAPVSLLSVLTNADPEKLGAVMDGVDELIRETQDAIDGLNSEEQAAEAEVETTTQQLAAAEQALTQAESVKNDAQQKYDEAESNLTGKEAREVEILEQVKAMLQTLLPQGFQPSDSEDTEAG